MFKKILSITLCSICIFMAGGSSICPSRRNDDFKHNTRADGSEYSY
ncbi:MAG: hypothetical protein ACLTJ5_11650 [Clostridium sp.]